MTNFLKLKARVSIASMDYYHSSAICQIHSFNLSVYFVQYCTFILVCNNLIVLFTFKIMFINPFFQQLKVLFLYFLYVFSFFAFAFTRMTHQKPLGCAIEEMVLWWSKSLNLNLRELYFNFQF